MYRVIQCPSWIKLNTITDPGKDYPLKDHLTPISEFITQVVKSPFEPKGFSLLSLSKATPAIMTGKVRVSWSPLGVLLGAVALCRSELTESYKLILGTLIDLTPSTERVSIKRFSKIVFYIFSMGLDKVPISPPMGKLGFKVEAAGKVRVFAMVEC